MCPQGACFPSLLKSNLPLFAALLLPDNGHLAIDFSAIHLLGVFCPTTGKFAPVGLAVGFSAGFHAGFYCQQHLLSPPITPALVFDSLLYWAHQQLLPWLNSPADSPQAFGGSGCGWKSDTAPWADSPQVSPGVWGVWMWLEIRYHTLLCQNRRNSMALHGKKTNVISIISQSQENKIFVSFQTQSLISEEHPVVCTLHSCSRGQGCSSVHTASSFLPFCFSQSLACSQDGGCSCHAPVAQLHPGVASGRFPVRLQHSKHFWGSFFPLMKNYF